jgi:hypothetical protein
VPDFFLWQFCNICRSGGAPLGRTSRFPRNPAMLRIDT